MKKNEASKWYAIQVGGNGEPINHSEPYSSKTECQDIHSRVAKQLGVSLIEEDD